MNGHFEEEDGDDARAAPTSPPRRGLQCLQALIYRAILRVQGFTKGFTKVYGGVYKT